jgi:hypothetical protein
MFPVGALDRLVAVEKLVDVPQIKAREAAGRQSRQDVTVWAR